eukprot:scaffold2321_cov245-Pinguiococcus_pyrenoidosus.AAC.5
MGAEAGADQGASELVRQSLPPRAHVLTQVAPRQTLAHEIASGHSGRGASKSKVLDAGDALAESAEQLEAGVLEVVRFEKKHGPRRRRTKRARYREQPAGTLRRRLLRLKGPSCIHKVLPAFTTNAPVGESLVSKDFLRPHASLADAYADLTAQSPGTSTGDAEKAEREDSMKLLRTAVLNAHALEENHPVYAVNESSRAIHAHMSRKVQNMVDQLQTPVTSTDALAPVPSLARAVAMRRRWFMVSSRDEDALRLWGTLERSRLASSKSILQDAKATVARIETGSATKRMRSLEEKAEKAARQLQKAREEEAAARKALAAAVEARRSVEVLQAKRSRDLQEERSAQRRELVRARESCDWEAFNVSSGKARLELIAKMLRFYQSADGLVEHVLVHSMCSVLRRLCQTLSQAQRRVERKPSTAKFIPTPFGLFPEEAAVTVSIEARTAHELISMIRRLWEGEMPPELSTELSKLEKWTEKARSSSAAALLAMSNKLVKKIWGSQENASATDEASGAWKTLLAESCNQEVSVALEREREFSKYCEHRPPTTSTLPVEQLKTLLSARVASTAGDASSGQREPPCTKVIFYAGVRHVTPADHWEGTSRMVACLRHLSKQPVADQDSGAHMLDFLCVTDVVPPSVETLALVHAPDYIYKILKRVGEIPEQGIVPLDVDSDWSCSSISEHNNSDLEDDAEEQASEAYSDDEREFLLSAAGFPDRSSSWRRCCRAGLRVRCSFGAGTLLSESFERSDNFAVIRMDFRATAFVVASDVVTEETGDFLNQIGIPKEREEPREVDHAVSAASAASAEKEEEAKEPSKTDENPSPRIAQEEIPVAVENDDSDYNRNRREVRAILDLQKLSQRRAAEQMKIDPACMSRFMSGKANQAAQDRVVKRMRAWLSKAGPELEALVKKKAAEEKDAINQAQSPEGSRLKKPSRPKKPANAGPFYAVNAGLRESLRAAQERRNLTDMDVIREVSAFSPRLQAIPSRISRFIDGFLTPDTPQGMEVVEAITDWLQGGTDRGASRRSQSEADGLKGPSASVSGAASNGQSSDGSPVTGKRLRRRSRSPADQIPEGTIWDVLKSLNEYVNLVDDPLLAPPLRVATLQQMISLALGVENGLEEMESFLERALQDVIGSASPQDKSAGEKMSVREWLSGFQGPSQPQAATGNQSAVASGGLLASGRSRKRRKILDMTSPPQKEPAVAEEKHRVGAAQIVQRPIFGRGIGDELRRVQASLKVEDLRCLLRFEMRRRRQHPMVVARELHAQVNRGGFPDGSAHDARSLAVDTIGNILVAFATTESRYHDATLAILPAIHGWIMASLKQPHAFGNTDSEVYRFWREDVLQRASRFSVLPKVPFGKSPFESLEVPPVPSMGSIVPELERRPHVAPTKSVLQRRSPAQSRGRKNARPEARPSNIDTSEIDFSLADRARTCINNIGRSQRSIAQLMQVDPSDLSRFLNYKCNYSTYTRIRERVRAWVEKSEVMLALQCLV